MSLSKIKEFIFEQKCIPWFIWDYFNNVLKPLLLGFKAKYNIVQNTNYSIASDGKMRSTFTFVIPHKDCSGFLSLCIDSIHRYASKVDYKVIIVDDCSDESEFSKIKSLVSDKVRLYRFAKPKGHPFSLEWLYHRSKSRYVVVLDQDAILISSRWQELVREFDGNEHLILVGLRDKCLFRASPQMIHPAFILIDKERTDNVLRTPLFFGDQPFYQNYTIGTREPYHALSCKALRFNPNGIRYLDTFQTKYGFGTVSYYQDMTNPIVYHQWYSGRIHLLPEEGTIDNVPVKFIKGGINKFLFDYKENNLDFEPVDCIGIEK